VPKHFHSARALLVEEDMTKKTAIVVGAGVGGMCAAFRLRRAGYSVTLFERLPYIGGRTRTISLNGCVVDTGGLMILSTYARTLALIAEVGLSSQLEIVKGQSVITRGSRIHSLNICHPVIALMASSLLGWRSKLALSKLFLLLILNRKKLNFYNLGLCGGLDEETIASYCQRELSSEVYEYLVNPMIKFLYLHNGERGSLVELLWWLKAVGPRPARALRNGTLSLLEALAEGINVRCDHEVTEVSCNAGRVAVRTTASDGKQERNEADCCVITTPAPDTHRIRNVWLGAHAKDFLASRVYDPTIVVSFCTSRRPRANLLMMQVPDSVDRELGVIIFGHNIGASRAPPDKGIVSVYFLSEWSRRHFDESDAQISSAAQQHACKLVPEILEVDACHVQKWMYTASITGVGACRKIREFIGDSENDGPIQVIGDYLVESSINVAITTAELAVSRILRGAAAHSPA
jgi:protoporphyrinogen/coproporphyrinogen III oxidase